ncbi:MAG: transcription antitermination factor NusB, partial [Alistipes sp.]
VSEKTLITSIDKAYDLYFQMLALPAEMVRYAETRVELNRNKQLPTHEDLNPNTKFIDNAVIRVLANSDSINDYVTSHRLGWAKHPDLIRTLYAQLIESDYFKKYMSAEERSFNEDRKMVEDFYGTLQDNEALDTVLEELSILWDNDLGFTLAMVLRTLSNLRALHTDVKIMPKFKSDDDLSFVKTLFEKTLINFSADQHYIDKFTSNWDVERIVFMDHLILSTAMTELTNFPSIPVKVTLDEFIEISKYYSTPGRTSPPPRRRLRA